MLSDPDQRARYDRFGEAGVGGAGGPNLGDMFGGGGLGDLFDAFFGGGGGPFGQGGGRGPAGPPRGQDLEVVADISFEQAVFGATVPVTVRTAVRCDDCERLGRRPRAPSRSPAASATAAARCSGCARACSARWSPRRCARAAAALGQVIVSPCPTCNGDGRIVTEKTYQVDIPAGVDTGSHAAPHRAAVPSVPRGGGAGDLYVHIRVAAHERFVRERRRPGHRAARLDRAGVARHASSPWPRSTATRRSSCRPGTQPGKEFVLRQRGVARLQGRGRGDLRVRVQVEVPTKLTDAEAELLRRFAEGRGEQVHTEHGLFSRIKSAFS